MGTFDVKLDRQTTILAGSESIVRKSAFDTPTLSHREAPLLARDTGDYDLDD